MCSTRIVPSLAGWCCQRGRALVLGAVVFASATVALTASGAEQFEVETSRSGDRIEVRARANIRAALPVVWGTLVDYENLPEFIPGLKRSRIIARNGATTTVEQSGEARFLFLAVPINVTVESTERPPVIEVRRVSGTLRHLQGRYETEVSADPAHVQLRWIGSIAPESDLPLWVGEVLVRHLIEQQFRGMVREIERREAARRAAATPAAGK